MTPNPNISAELQGISPYLAGLAQQVPYAVPVGYFDQLPEQLLQLVKTADDPSAELAELSPFLSGLARKTPFSAPPGYFDQVPDEVSAGISAIEQTAEVLETLHPILAAAKHINPYRVPVNYFEELPAILLEKRPQQGRVIGINKNWFKYAAAAIIIGFVALASWLYKPVATTMPADNALALQLEQEINQLSDDAIFNFADSTELLLQGSTANNDELLDATDIHILFEDVSDGALQQYLAEQPGKAILFNN